MHADIEIVSAVSVYPTRFPAVYIAGFMAGQERQPARRRIGSNPCPLWSDAWNAWRAGYVAGERQREATRHDH